MKLKIYQIDAFTDRIFSGNPAAICPLEKWPDDSVMQRIAMENNLAETAFYVKNGSKYEIRWFTPTVEVDLCGHATLAAAYVLYHHEGHSADVIDWVSPRSGPLTVIQEGDFITLNFPTDTLSEVSLSDSLLRCFDIRPVSAFKGKTDYLLVFENEKTVRELIPKLDKIAQLNARGLIVTAPGNEVDFVSRFFGPQSGINEDPVTGSAHTSLTPYWAERLHKKEFSALQLSPRGGVLQCTLLGNRVAISGQARLYMTGEIHLP